MDRRTLIKTILASAALYGPVAYGNDWPTRSIRIIVPFPAGGSTDILGRATADYMQRSLNMPVVVENVPGATGTIGVRNVARSVPDGYTFLMGSIGTVVTNHFVFNDLPYTIDSLDPVITIAETSNIVMVRPSLNVNSLAELIEYMKANPGKLNFGSPGIASSSHVSTEVFLQRVGAEAEIIHYRGSAPMLADLMGSTLDVSIDNISSSIELVKGGRLKALAVTSRNRSALLPDVPTVIESGLPDYIMAPWFCVAAPAGTPQPVIQVVNKVLNSMLEDESTRKLLLSYGAVPVGGSADDLRKLIAQDAEVIRELSKKVDFKAKS